MADSLGSIADPAAARAGWNFRLLAIGQTLARALAFFTTAYLVRALGPDGFGVVGFAYALTGYFALAVTAGLNTVGATLVSTDRNRARSIAADVIGVRLVMAAVALLLSVGLAWALPKPSAVKWVIILTGLTYFTRAVNTDWVHKGLETNERVGKGLVLTEVVQLALVLLLVDSPEDVVLVPLALFLAQLVSDAYLIWPLVLKGLPRPHMARGFAIFKSTLPLTMTKLMRTALYTIDILFLGFMLGERAVGLYDAPGRIGWFIVALSGTLVFSFLPDLARSRRDGADATAAVLARALGFAVFISAPVLVGGGIVAAPLLDALFGAPYAEVALVLQLILLRVSLIFFRDSLESVLIVYDRLAPEMWVMAAAVVLAVCLNAVMIPAFGIPGAAFATLLTECVVVAGQVVLVRSCGIRVSIPGAGRILVVSAVMGGVVALLLGRVHVFLLVGLGAGVYVGAALLLNAVPEDVQAMFAKPPRNPSRKREG